jgi:photosystem II stability/assembly factor-like uncharacterized protein
MYRTTAVAALVLCFVLPLVGSGLLRAAPATDTSPAFDPKLLDLFVARPLGPANMGGRIVDVAVVENRPGTMYAASASGGLWKTINNGITWAPVFDHQTTVSLGAVAVTPNHPEIVWAGTGEANARNSVSWGDGIYKSTDAGKTWMNMGLRDTEHIARIVVHPRNPDIVYVAAPGHFWGPNRERGLYKTLDGGRSWLPIKHFDESTGCSEVVMDPSDPETLYLVAYRVRRDGFAAGNPAEQFGPLAGLYKTTDGGQSWQRLTAGLPERPLGRCGLAVCRKDPRILYAVIQTDKTPLRREAEWGQAAKTSNKTETGGVFRSDDRGETWTKLNDLCPRPFYFSQVRVDPADENRVYVCGVNLHVSADGGKTFRSNAAEGTHADHHALWIDPADSSHLVLGGDGGLYFSYDRGSSWEHLMNLPLAQFYAVAVDLRKPYRVYGGLQDNGSWGGPSATHNPEGITVTDWFKVLGADGFYCQVDPTDPAIVYAEGQYGSLSRINVQTGEASSIVPRPREDAPAYRFNWSAPLLLSPHNPHTLYYGGNHLSRSLDRGEHWLEISPDLTRGKPGPSADNGHTITTIAESPLRSGALFAGTDDGRVQVTRNGGGEWTDVSDKVPGVPADRWISRLEASHFQASIAYLAIDRHRQDDHRPYLFRTSDYGATWTNLANNLPAEGPVHVIREDPRNKDLLFVGTEFGLYVSLDAGAIWHPLKGGLPTVAVHDLVIHPREHDLVIATHGRGMYVLDIDPLEQLTPKVLGTSAYLFDPKPAGTFQYHSGHGLSGGKVYAAPNPPFGASVNYYLREKPSQTVRLTVADPLGTTLAVLKAEDEPGLHRATWDLRASVGLGPVRYGPLVPPGDYLLRLEIGEKVLLKKLKVEAEE